MKSSMQTQNKQKKNQNKQHRDWVREKYRRERQWYSQNEFDEGESTLQIAVHSNVLLAYIIWYDRRACVNNIVKNAQFVIMNRGIGII